MRKYLCAAGVAAVAALLTAIPALASSDAVLSDTHPNPNGTNTASAATINGTNSGSATITTTAGGSTGITCSTVNGIPGSTTSATVNSGGNPTAPGTASLTLNNQGFANCTTNISGTRSVKSITLNHLPYNVSITSSPPDSVTIAPGSNGNIDVTATLTNLVGQPFSCSYHVHDSTGDVFGTAGNGTNTITFTNQQFDLDSNPNFQCIVTSTFLSVTYTQVDHSNGDAPVYAN